MRNTVSTFSQGLYYSYFTFTVRFAHLIQLYNPKREQTG